MGSMGHASAIASGIAIAKPSRNVRTTRFVALTALCTRVLPTSLTSWR